MELKESLCMRLWLFCHLKPWKPHFVPGKVVLALAEGGQGSPPALHFPEAEVPQPRNVSPGRQPVHPETGSQGLRLLSRGAHLREDDPAVPGAGAVPRGDPAGGPGPAPAPALVEDPAVRVGAGAVRDLGWCVHILHDQHFWGCPLLKNRLAGGKHRRAHGHASGVFCGHRGPGHRAVWHRHRGAQRYGQRRRLLHDRLRPWRADGRHHRAAVCVWTEHGFIGYSPELLWNNTFPDYSPGESFFTVFGVFFPAATGVMAGFNMGGDLREPSDSIPLGSLAAVGISWFLYIIFTFLLGAICTREALRYDFLIAEKVSLVGFLFLLGLYISSLASCMGGLYGAPRILQCIAQEKVIPALACLGKGKGPNKTPVAAICLTSVVTMAFVLVGQVNILAPIVTISFMLTYVAVDYSYFSLSMVPCAVPQVPEPVLREDSQAGHCSEHLLLDKAPSYGSEGTAQSFSEGTLLEFTKDMDQLLQLTRKLDSGHPRPGEGDRISENQKRKCRKATKQALQDSFLLDLNSPNSLPSEGPEVLPTASWEGEGYQDKWTSRSEDTWPEVAHRELVPELGGHHRVSGEDFFLKSKLQEQEIQRRSTSFYTHMCNPWVSLLGAAGSLLIMLVTQWIYTLVSMSAAAVLYFYIGRASPGLHLGSASNFSFFRWMRSLLIPSCRSLQSPQEQIILAPSLARVDMAMTQLTQENADFATRDRYHHSSLVSREQLMPPY
ncbi:solute carrier family 12 member 8 isoform X3 [Cavia porcellus]|uniref:solute carrier family 12 member 8 isoform X3 n=1 Tax=Cavia porcellus TaxID=10141 RepID=UPI002FDFA127